MIRGVFVIGPNHEILYSKEYAKTEPADGTTEFIASLSQFLSRVDLGDRIDFMNVSTLRLFYARRSQFTFVFVADKADDTAQIEEKMRQLLDLFMKDFASVALAGQSLDGFDVKVDEITVTMVKVAILGFAGVGKTTTLRLLRGETLPLVHEPTIGVSIKNLPSEVSAANIVLWDVAGQSKFSVIWAKMVANAQVVVIVTDSTLENVLRSKKLVTMVREVVPDARIIGIANKQDLPMALTPERVGQILGIPTYELVAIDISYRDRLIQIIRRAILEGKTDTKPS
ncbi:MAG: ADP-ribosylation factor-like protein [Candidatus Thorarchaeota archaeon]